MVRIYIARKRAAELGAFLGWATMATTLVSSALTCGAPEHSVRVLAALVLVLFGRGNALLTATAIFAAIVHDR